MQVVESQREKTQKGKNQITLDANCEAAKATTARLVRLTPAAVATLSPSPHSVTPRLLLERGSAIPGLAQSQIWYFFFFFLFLFLSYFVLIYCLLVVTYLLCYFVSCLEFRQFSYFDRIIVFNIILFFIHLFDNLYFMFLVFTVYIILYSFILYRTSCILFFFLVMLLYSKTCRRIV